MAVSRLTRRITADGTKVRSLIDSNIVDLQLAWKRESGQVDRLEAV